MQTYRDLIVWQKAVDLAVAIYKLATLLPREETYGLSSQMKRSAVSVSANIAEGRMRGGEAEFRRFLRIALASGAELETHLELMKRLYTYPTEHYGVPESTLKEVMKMLNSLISRLEKLAS